MKIALVTDAIYPYHNGGKEKRTYEISTRLVKKGHEVHIYCMKWWDGPEERIEQGVHLHGISPLYPLYKGSTRSIKQGLLFGLSCLKVAAQNFDVIEVDHMPYFPLFFTKVACILQRKKMIATWHEVWGKDYWLHYIGWKGIFGYLIESASLKTPDKIISVSRNTTHRLTHECQFTKNIHTIPNGIDIKHINSIKPAKDSYDVIFVGRLLKHKNVDELIRAIKLLRLKFPQIQCIIVGDGPEKEFLNNLVKHHHLEKHVRLTGFISKYDDVYAFMKSAKVFVLPSAREGFGIAVIEANACGLPVITIDHKDNASKDLITPQTGRVTMLAPHSIAKSIEGYLRSSQSHSNACVRYASTYDWNISVNHLLEAYAS